MGLLWDCYGKCCYMPQLLTLSASRTILAIYECRRRYLLSNGCNPYPVTVIAIFIAKLNRCIPYPVSVSAIAAQNANWIDKRHTLRHALIYGSQRKPLLDRAIFGKLAPGLTLKKIKPVGCNP